MLEIKAKTYRVSKQMDSKILLSTITLDVLTLTIAYIAVCEIIFETWTDALSGHDKVCMDISGVVWTLC